MGDSAVLDLTAGVVCRGIIRAMIGSGKLLRTAGGLSQGDGGKKFALLGRYDGPHPWRCVQEWSGLHPLRCPWVLNRGKVLCCVDVEPVGDWVEEAVWPVVGR